MSENGELTWCGEAANGGRGGEERFGRIPCVVLVVWDSSEGYEAAKTAADSAKELAPAVR